MKLFSKHRDTEEGMVPPARISDPEVTGA
jgi:hypothetical protein